MLEKNQQKHYTVRCHRLAAESASEEDDADDRYGERNAVSLLSLRGRNAADIRLFSFVTESHSDLRRNTQHCGQQATYQYILVTAV